MQNNSVVEKLIHGTEALGKAAVKVAPGIIGGIVGGPAGAKAGAAIGGLASKALSKKKGGGGFTPSSAGSIEEARGQDKARMSDQYGLGNNGG